MAVLLEHDALPFAGTSRISQRDVTRNGKHGQEHGTVRPRVRQVETYLRRTHGNERRQVV